MTAVLNTSSNLRLRSGIAPVETMIENGVRIAIGIDALSLDDDDDALRELRLTYRLHAGRSFDTVLTPERLFAAAMRSGAEAVGGRGPYGEIDAGAAADLMVLDYKAISHDVIEDRIDEIDILLGRACRHHIRSVVAGGREIVREGKLTGLDQARTGAGAGETFLSPYCGATRPPSVVSTATAGISVRACPIPIVSVRPVGLSSRDRHQGR